MHEYFRKPGKYYSHSATNSFAHMEPAFPNALPHPNEGKPDDQRVHIHIHSVRKRPVDPDGVSAKAAIDGIVEAGLLADDNCEIVESVTFSQAKGDPEQTVITLEFKQRLKELEA